MTTNTCPQCTYALWVDTPPRWFAMILVITLSTAKQAAFLYDGISFTLIEVGGDYISAYAALVNEIGQAVIVTVEDY